MSEETKVAKPSLFGMIWSPTEQFEKIKERPIIWGAMSIIIILFIIGLVLTTIGMEIPELQDIPEEELGIFKTITTVTMIIGGIISPLFGALIASFIYWLIAKMARSEVTFKQLFSMNTYMMIISAISIIVNGLGIALIGGTSETLFTSLGSLVDVDGAMGGLLNSLEVFSIWGVILSAIGLHKVANFSKGLAWTISIAFFIVGVIIAMIGAAFSGMVGV